MTMHDQTKRGQITWHTSEEDGGPDVGVSIGLGAGQLWIGELSRKRWEESGGEAMNLGSDGGSWIVLYRDATSDPIILGRCSAEMMHSEIGELFAAMIGTPS